jgi:hypothetical protein
MHECSAINGLIGRLVRLPPQSFMDSDRSSPPSGSPDIMTLRLRPADRVVQRTLGDQPFPVVSTAAVGSSCPGRADSRVGTAGRFDFEQWRALQRDAP